MRLFQPDTRSRRTMGALFAISFVIAILLTTFFETQVVSGEQYAARSEQNRLRPVTIPAPRGTIVDRYGEIVATSIPGFAVLLLPGDNGTVEQTLRDLMPFLGLAETDVQRLLKQRKARPHDLLTITEDATFSQTAALEERRTSFPNLLVVERPKRSYPAGEALGHLVGYVAEISKEELQQPRYREAGYTQGRWIGKAGLEKEYELYLSGQDGARFVEVDAMGRIVNPRSSVGVLPPVPGKELKLTLDLELQKYLAQIFPDTMKGAIVAMEPGTGDVLALYSNPSYDPNDFVGGIPSRLWRALSTDPLKPLLDRTINALYPPGSTWKLATAAAALEAGKIKPNSRMPIPCNGGMFYAGRYARCWDHSGHGFQDLVGAIKTSCDVYFYQLGILLGLKELAAEGTRMGFGSRTGIDLPNESESIFPTGPETYMKRFHYVAPSEVMSLAIGQGPNSQSPLNMALFYSALASGDGKSHRPHLLAGDSARAAAGSVDLNLSKESLAAMWEGLRQVVAEGGTAYLSSLGRWTLYGKTGTSQNPPYPDHGWFAGFAGPPGKAPEVVVVAIVEHGLHGSDVAPLVSKTAEFYLDRKYHIPVDYQPTLIERWESERCSWGVNCIPGQKAAESPKPAATTPAAPVE